MEVGMVEVLIGGGVGLVSTILGGIYKKQEVANDMQLKWMEMFKEVATQHEPNGNHKHTHDRLSALIEKTNGTNKRIDDNHAVMVDIRDGIRELNSNLNTRPCIRD